MSISSVSFSTLGILTGRFNLDERWPLLAMRCYSDGSETSGIEDNWLTLATLVASDPVWIRFQKEWEDMLGARYPKAPYLHMTDLISGTDPFESVNGWTFEKKKTLVYDAGEVLRGFDVNRLCAVYCTVNLSARNRLIEEGYEIGDPFALCAESSIFQAMHWHRAKHPIEIAYLFYDRGEKFKSVLSDTWNEYEKKPVKDVAWGQIGGISEVDMKVTPPIQAADLIAWSISRAHRDAPGDLWATIAGDLVWTKDKRTGKQMPGMLTTTGIIADENILRKKSTKIIGRIPPT